MHPNTYWLISTWVCKKILDLEKGCTYVRHIHWEIDQENVLSTQEFIIMMAFFFLSQNTNLLFNPYSLKDPHNVQISDPNSLTTKR